MYEPFTGLENIRTHAMPNPTYLPTDTYSKICEGQPFTSVVLNRAEILKLKDKQRVDELSSFPENERLTESMANTLDIDTLIDEHPQIVECVFVDLGSPKVSRDKSWRNNFLRVFRQSARYASQTRRPWKRGEAGKSEVGQALSTHSRVDHHGVLG